MFAQVHVDVNVNVRRLQMANKTASATSSSIPWVADHIEDYYGYDSRSNPPPPPTHPPTQLTHQCLTVRAEK